MVMDTPPDDPVLTAEVLFFTDKGARLPSKMGQITPENLASFEPSAVAMDTAREAFEALGFDVLAGSLSLTIAGSASLFEQIFQVTIGETHKPVELTVPEELEGIVDAIILNEPYELY